ncbi:hypothetical protein P389DRAFT_43741 [Cystobasidium minutum MCA 4210]|uniref:uncharacterized protein n=1 Tax=Cystobasidium minutum MCA 4210 TaxID=1397322 RepID=UPI0034CF3D5D|eukprot:jgi/Rhomi1/43741/CE43740_883
MAATEGYSVPGQNGDASTSTVGGGAGQSGLGRSSEPTFSAALTVWKDINLGDLQKTLDAQGLEIIDNQKENMMGRKKLAEQTREFKKVPDDEKLGMFKTLLKAYQTEIDSLTRRSKVSENAFLNVYKLLAEAPDPYPLLDAAVDQTARASEAKLLESEVARLKEDNANLKKDLVEAQSVERERKKLQEKHEKLEAKMEEQIAEKVSAKEAELNATYDERLRNYEDRERDLQKQVTTVKQQLRDLRMSNESTQAKLLDQGSRQDQEVEARLQEMDLLTADLERANSRVAEVERRNEKLRAEIELVRSGSESADKVKSLEMQIADLQSEAERLLRSLDLQKEEAERQKDQASKREKELSKSSEATRAELETLREKVKQYSDYDEVKRELEIMKYIEFAGAEIDNDADGAMTEFADEEDDFTSSIGGATSSLRLPNPNAEKANLHHGRPLEGLLMSKNRRLQDGMTRLRVAQEELTASLQNTRSELEEITAKYEDQKSLNEKLENDLMRINGSTPAQPAGGSSTGTGTPKGGPSAAGLLAPTDASDPLAALNIGRKSMDSSPAPQTNSSAETSILPIITSQRDRFRQRNAELEEQLLRQSEIVSELRNEIKSLQADNLKLYEKVRYLESYSAGVGSGSPAPSSLRNLVGSNRRDEELGKYKSLYEDQMNPFEAFKGREQSRAVGNLNPAEKILLNLSKFTLGNRVARNTFVVYALGLHIFVFMSLFSSAASPNDLQAVPAPHV